MKKIISYTLMIAFLTTLTTEVMACTGITLKSKDGATILARTIETGHVELKSNYVIVPRGKEQQSYLPTGKQDGLKYTTKYGYLGFTVEGNDFFVDGINEKGFSAALFYFPKYGEYPKYEPDLDKETIADLQLVGWALGNFNSTKEIEEAIKTIRPTKLFSQSGSVHWRFTDKTGRQIVLEYINGNAVIYENELGVLTNAPDFDWQMKNLNNYVNLKAAEIPPHKLGNSSIELSPFGAGAGLIGLPGDFSPTSRFVRAAFLQTHSKQLQTGFDTVMQSFHILNSFDIPVETEYGLNNIPHWMPSATQWTVAFDIKNMKAYYHTMHNREIRMIDINEIDFSKTFYQFAPMEEIKKQPIKKIDIFHISDE